MSVNLHLGQTYRSGDQTVTEGSSRCSLARHGMPTSICVVEMLLFDPFLDI